MTTKLEIVAAVIMILLLVALSLADLIAFTGTACWGVDDEYLSDSNSTYFLHKFDIPYFYMFSIIGCAVVYSVIFYMHLKRVSTQRGKWLIAATAVVAILVILPMRFYVGLPRWDIEFRILLAIDFIAIVAFLLLNFIQDTNHTILVTFFFSTPLVSLYTGPYTSFVCEYTYEYQYYYEKLDHINLIAVICTLGIVYLIILWLYAKHVSSYFWKAMTILAFIFIIAIAAFLFHIHIFVGLYASYYLLMCVNTVLAFVLWLWMYRARLKEWHDIYKRDKYQDNVRRIAGGPPRFPLKDLDKATGNFQTPIGEGGSATVFKGVMGDGSLIAVKRIKGQPSMEQEFENEIRIIASSRHLNLVHLLGYCLSPRGDRYLVYPFFENGSLDSWIFAEEEKRSRLTWMSRYGIAVAVAKALAYLHYGCRRRILHLDVKPANILLDGSFTALLSDFGISKTIGREESSVRTRARGTIGYLPPEMLVPNAISVKSDVYSYGMVLLELVGGRRNFQSTVDKGTQQTRNTYFPKIVKEKMHEGKLMEMVDRSLIDHEDIKEEEVTILVLVALWCIQESPQLRPTTNEVLDMLEGRTKVNMPPESPMFVVNFLNMELRSTSGRAHALEDEETLLSRDNISISIQSC